MGSRSLIGPSDLSLEPGDDEITGFIEARNAPGGPGAVSTYGPCHIGIIDIRIVLDPGDTAHIALAPDPAAVSVHGKGPDIAEVRPLGASRKSPCKAVPALSVDCYVLC